MKIKDCCDICQSKAYHHIPNYGLGERFLCKEHFAEFKNNIEEWKKSWKTKPIKGVQFPKKKSKLYPCTVRHLW